MAIVPHRPDGCPIKDRWSCAITCLAPGSVFSSQQTTNSSDAADNTITEWHDTDPPVAQPSVAAIQAKVKDITNTPAYINGKRAAESIQRSKDAVRDVREKTEATIATDVEKFHTESRNSTYVTHIFGLLQKNFPQNYLPSVITEVELREDITKVLNRVNKRYNPKTTKDKSAYAQAVYKLFSDSYAESGGILQ